MKAKSEFTLVGIRLSEKTTNENNQSMQDIGALWQDFEKNKIAERIKNKSSNDVYAVYFDYEGDHTKPFSYFIGFPVDKVELDEGLSSLTIPAADYEVFLAKGKMPDCIGITWRLIWNSKVKRSYRYDFEVYGKRSADWSNAEVEIYIS